MGKGIVGSPTNIHRIPKNRGEDWIKPYKFTKEYKLGGDIKYHHRKKSKFAKRFNGQVKKSEWFERLKKEWEKENESNISD